MQTQVITITPSGEMQSLQRKRGRGVDVRQFGHTAIERASEITWNEPQQCWHVRLLNRNVLEWMYPKQSRMIERGEGATLNMLHWSRAMPTREMGEISAFANLPKGATSLPPSWLAFEDYDDAVAAEVAFLDALRLQAVF